MSDDRKLWVERVVKQLHTIDTILDDLVASLDEYHRLDEYADRRSILYLLYQAISEGFFKGIKFEKENRGIE